MQVKIAQTDDDIERCFPIMLQLRSGLTNASFLERVQRQAQRYGYTLIYVEDAGAIKSIAGFIIREMLPLGRFLYVDDIVTDASERSKGYGGFLFRWLVAYAKEHDCRHLHLDSRIERTDAHRFYLSQGMRISGYHFALDLNNIAA